MTTDTLPPLPPDPDDSIDTPDHVLDAYEAARAEPAPVTLAPGDTVWITVDVIGHGQVHPCEAAADVTVDLCRHRRPLTKVKAIAVEVAA